MGPFLRICSTLLLAAAFLLYGLPASADLMWITGTASMTAFDKDLAHQLALSEARRNAESAACEGPYGAPIERSVSYERNDATGEWRATVTVRESCITDTHSTD